MTTDVNESTDAAPTRAEWSSFRDAVLAVRRCGITSSDPKLTDAKMNKAFNRVDQAIDDGKTITQAIRDDNVPLVLINAFRRRLESADDAAAMEMLFANRPPQSTGSLRGTVMRSKLWLLLAFGTATWWIHHQYLRARWENLAEDFGMRLGGLVNIGGVSLLPLSLLILGFSLLAWPWVRSHVWPRQESPVMNSRWIPISVEAAVGAVIVFAAGAEMLFPYFELLSGLS